jgi:antitoxin component YwqK of YwqJK toxin-antitoxin module
MGSMKRALLLVLAFALCSNSQGQSNSIAHDSIGKVKSKKRFSSPQSTRVLDTDEFEYNSTGRLIREMRYMGDKELLIHYDIFKYDPDGRLMFKLGYHANVNSPTGFYLVDSTAYFYRATLIASNKTTYPMAQYADSCSYEYENQVLKKESKYSRGKFESTVEFVYDHDLLQTETFHATDNHVYQTITHQYKDGLLRESCYYNTMGLLTRSIAYAYGSAGKLILESSESASFSSLSPHVLRYEY